MKISKFIGVLMCSWGMTGCATILTDSLATVNIQTTSGKQVEVTIDGKHYLAPTIARLEKNGTNKVIMTDDSSCAKETHMPRQIEPTFWVNILTGGLLGSTTDAASSKMWTYDDNVTINCQ